MDIQALFLFMTMVWVGVIMFHVSNIEAKAEKIVAALEARNKRDGINP